MDPGPMDEHGSYSPELASMTYAEAVRKGWRKRPEKCPPFWRPALQKALDARHQLQERAALAERFGVTDSAAAAVHRDRLARNETLLRRQFPGWC